MVRSVYIVEDEAWIRARIKKMIHWDALGLSLAGESGNGLEAREEILQLQPDIVISDIRIPDMDGLELIESIAGKVSAKTIFISGYREFEYARKAIELKAVSYILKPIQEEELNSLLRDTLEKINQEQMRETQDRISKNTYLLNVLEERIDTSEATEQQEDDGSKKYCVLLAPTEEEGFDEKLNEYLGRHLSAGIQGTAFKKHQFEYVIILTAATKVNAEEKLRACAREVLDYFSARYQQLTWTLGSIVDSLSEIPVSYNHAWIAYTYRGIDDEGVLLQYDEAGQYSFLLPSRDRTEQLHYAIETGKYEKLRETARDILKEMAENNRMSAQNIIDCVFYLTMDLVRLLQKEGIGTSKYYEKCQELLSARFRYKRITDISQWFLDFVEDLIEAVDQKSTKSIYLAVMKVKDYIDRHYMEHITLQSMAEMVFINSSYLSASFKKITGDKFTNYIMQKRIEKASEILIDTQLCIAEIAQLVGYDNVRHFSQTFRKYKGCLPSEYRELQKNMRGSRDGSNKK